MVNRTMLFRSRGRALASYDKRRRFIFQQRDEAIEPGKHLLVVVAEDRLVAVAICRDFCDDCADDVYHWLGADVVLVPSMGDQKSTDAHRRAAKSLQSRQGAVTFVVQQVPTEIGSGSPGVQAYSFASPPPADDTGYVVPSEVQTTTFRTLRARR